MVFPHLVVVVYIAPAFSAFEAIAPHDALSLVPDSRIVYASRTGGIVASDTGMVKLATVPLSEVPAADVLYIPGGAVLVDASDDLFVDEFRRLERGTEYTAWACVGGWLPGVLGLLRAVRVADDGWTPMPDYGQIRVPSRVVVDGKYISAGNAASSVDLALLLVARYADQRDARAIQVGMEYDLDIFSPPFEPRKLQRVSSEERERFLRLVRQGSRGRAFRELSDRSAGTTAGEP